MALILNIETATKICSVALAKDGKVIASKETSEGNSHSTKLAPFIKEIMEQSGYSFADLQAVAVSMGPGSYTGLRIGVSTAKGLCFGLDIPLIAVSTLAAMAVQAKNQYPNLEENMLLSPMIDARRMEAYSQFFDTDLKPLNEISAIIIDEETYKTELNKQPILFFGDGALKCEPIINNSKALFFEGGLPSAEGMSPLAEQQFQKEDFADVAYFEPFYLKEFVAAISKVKGLK
jgi:tRNA threonylcarbamoyladenosine biosynthesis protein TsaB